MLIRASKQITSFSENSKINSENYIEFLSYINNLYSFINKIKTVVAFESITFEPTFKGQITCEKFGLYSTAEENEMRKIVVRSKLFLEDKIRDNVILKMGNVCKTIDFKGERVEFILR